MRKSKNDDIVTGVRIGGRRINNLRYVDNTTVGRKYRGLDETAAESEEGK